MIMDNKPTQQTLEKYGDFSKSIIFEENQACVDPGENILIERTGLNLFDTLKY